MEILIEAEQPDSFISADSPESMDTMMRSLGNSKAVAEMERFTALSGYEVNHDLGDIMNVATALGTGDANYGYGVGVDGKPRMFIMDSMTGDFKKPEEYAEDIETYGEFYRSTGDKGGAEVLKRTMSDSLMPPGFMKESRARDLFPHAIKQFQEDGLISPDFDPQAEVSVESGTPIDIERDLRMGNAMLKKGIPVADVASTVLGQLATRDDFKALGDAAKAYYMGVAVKKMDALDVANKSRVMSQAAYSMTQAEDQLDQTASAIDASNVFIKDPQAMAKAQAQIPELNTQAAEAEIQSSKLETARAAAQAEVRKMSGAAYHDYAHETSYDEAKRELNKRKAKVQEIETAFEATKANANHLSKMRDQAIDRATNGIRFSGPEIEQAFLAGAAGRSEMIDLSNMIGITPDMLRLPGGAPIGAGQILFENAQELRGIVAGQMYREAFARQTKENPAIAPVLNKIMQEKIRQAEKGIMSPAVKEQADNLLYKFQNEKIAKASTPITEKDVEQTVKAFQKTTNNIMNPDISASTDTLGELQQELNGLVDYIDRSTLTPDKKQAFAQDAQTFVREAERAVVAFDAVRDSGANVMTGPELVEDMTGFNVLAMANELEGQTLKLEDMPEVFRLLAGPDYEAKGTATNVKKAIKDGDATRIKVPFANKIRTMNVALDAVLRGQIQGDEFKDEIFVKSVKDMTGMFRASLNKMPDDPRYFQAQAKEYQMRVNQLREARKILNPAEYEKFERAKKAESLTALRRETHPGLTAY